TEETAKLTREAGIDHLVRRDGALELYESEAEWRASLAAWKRCQEAGIEVEHVDGERLGELQPGLSPRLTKAVFMPQWQTVSDPRDYALAVLKAAQDRGVEVMTGHVASLGETARGVRLT